MLTVGFVSFRTIRDRTLSLTTLICILQKEFEVHLLHCSFNNLLSITSSVKPSVVDQVGRSLICALPEPCSFRIAVFSRGAQKGALVGD